MGIAPRFGFRPKNLVIVLDVAIEWNIAIEYDRRWPFRGDLVGQPLPYPRVCRFDVGWIGEALISVGDKR
jgi:hypothetical protein